VYIHAYISFAGVGKQQNSTAIICGVLESLNLFHLTVLWLGWFIRHVNSYLNRKGNFGGYSSKTVFIFHLIIVVLMPGTVIYIYTVCFGENQFGIIQYFLEVSDRTCNSTCVLAVVNVLSVESYHNLPHLYLCRTTSIFKAIHSDTLNYKCVYVALCGTQFIGVFPSRIISLLS